MKLARGWRQGTSLFRCRLIYTSRAVSKHDPKLEQKRLDDLVKNVLDLQTDTTDSAIASRDRRNRGYPKLDDTWKKTLSLKENFESEKHPDHAQMYMLPDDYGVRNLDVQAGDFVEARKSSITYLGVILPIPEDREVLGSGQGASLIMVLATGELEQIRATDIMLQMPGFVDAETATMAAPLKWDHVVASTTRTASSSTSPGTDLANDVPSDAGEPFDYTRFSTRAKICRKIREMQRDLDREIRRIYPAFRTLFLEEQESMSLMEQSPTVKKEHRIRKNALDLMQSGQVPTSIVAQCLEQSLANSAKRLRVKASTYLATHSLLMNHPDQFLADSTSHRRSQSFVYRSQREQRILKKVSGWVHDFVSAADDEKSLNAKLIIQGFCDRARHVLKWKRSQEYSADESISEDRPVPSDDGEGLFRWTQEDKDILAFFKISLGNRRELQDNTTGSVAMAIIKQLGLNVRLAPLHHDESSSHKNVPIAVGDMKELETDIAQAGFDLQHSQMFNLLVELGMLAPWENPNTLDTQLKNLHYTSETFKQMGPLMEEQESRHSFGNLPVYVIDSENAHELDDGISIEKAEGKSNFWVHIHIADPTAWIDLKHPLAKLAEHQYASIYLPENMWPMLPEAVTKGRMSLSDGNKEGMNVLSFSALVDLESGKVEEYNVRRGKIHNVKIMSYKAVNNIFKNARVGEESQPTESAQNLSLLAEAASVVAKRRVRVGGAVNAGDPETELKISPLPLPSLADDALGAPKFFRGFPKIQLLSQNDIERLGSYDNLPGGISAESMVSEMMILAGRIAASFGMDHNIPLPHRAQAAPEEGDIKVIESMKHPVTGALSMSELVSRGVFLPVGFLSIKPGNHFALGIRPMLKNDPLADALYKGGYLFSPEKKPPLDAVALSRKLIQCDRMETWVRQLERSSERFWIWTFVDAFLRKRSRQQDSGKTLSTEMCTPSERLLLGPLNALQGIMDVRFNADTLESRIRVSLPQLGGIPVDCTWPTGEPPPARSSIKSVQIIKTISAGAKRTILCSPLRY
ncbi:exoribonuclease II, partial [Malassezia nana]